MRRRTLLTLPLGMGPIMGNAEDRAAAAARHTLPGLREAMAKAGLQPGQPVHLRIHKEPKELELWVRPPGAHGFRLFRTYPIATWGAGRLGPKTRQGDGQAPEGFYFTDRRSLNPHSKYHLSFNVNYPNEYDRAHGRTGNLIMVHGSEVSIGCYAMTDPGIKEIYTLAAAALAAGQPTIAIHCFPFRMTAERLAAAAGNPDEAPCLAFWNELAPGWRFFEQHHLPPGVAVRDGRYVIG